MTGIQVGMNVVWHRKLRATQNFYSGEFNFALSIAFQSNGGDAWKKNRGDENFMADPLWEIEETAQGLTSKRWEEQQKLLETRKLTLI